MNGFHPNAKRAAACALTALLVVGGCRSSSSVATNPFMGPDRVAPPSTRMLAPGQAQPYYQGDPLPVMHSSTAPAAGGPLASDSTSRSDSGKALAWNAPTATSPAQSASAVSAAGMPSAPPQPTSIAANEQPVSVPTDANGLRFSLPAAVPSTAPQIATTNAATSPSATVPLLNAPSSSNAPSPQGVALASYTAPAVATNNGGLTPISTTPSLTPATVSTSPWQKPQLTSSAQPSAVVTQPLHMNSVASPASGLTSQPITTQPRQLIALPSNTMAVDLRSVPSPAPEPGDPTPRVRIPGYEVPQSANADGFRPRTSMR